MRWLKLLLFVVLADSGRTAEEIAVDLNQADTYRSIFDAGLRPRKAFRDATDGLLEIRPAKDLAFRIGDMILPKLKAVWTFNIANNDQVTLIRGVVSDAWTKSVAYEKTRLLERALGGNEPALKVWIDAYPSPSPTGDLWGRRWRSEDGTRSVRYYFRHTMQDARPLTMTVSIELRWPGRKWGFREKPLEPPAGYELVDISFEETYGGTATVPERTESSLKERGMATEGAAGDARCGRCSIYTREITWMDRAGNHRRVAASGSGGGAGAMAAAAPTAFVMRILTPAASSRRRPGVRSRNAIPFDFRRGSRKLGA